MTTLQPGAVLEDAPRVGLLADDQTLRRYAARAVGGSSANGAAVPRFDVLRAHAQTLGTVVVARCYSDWSDMDGRQAAHEAGFEPVFAPVLRTSSDPIGKRLTTSQVVVDGMDLLWQDKVDVLLLATHDKDVAPLALAAKRRGVRVVVVGGLDTSPLLREIADDVVSYRALLGGEPETDEEVFAQLHHHVPPSSTSRTPAGRARRRGRVGAEAAPPEPAPTPATATRTRRRRSAPVPADGQPAAEVREEVQPSLPESPVVEAPSPEAPPARRSRRRRTRESAMESPAASSAPSAPAEAEQGLAASEPDDGTTETQGGALSTLRRVVAGGLRRVRRPRQREAAAPGAEPGEQTP